MIAISLKRPVTVTMVVCLIVVLGVISYLRLGRDLLPDIAYPSLTVQTNYEGAAPQEVEEYITKPLESALATVKGKRNISSISREGVSLITIEFEWGHDMQFAILHVREKLDVARFQAGFPQDADRPNILRWDPSSKPIVGLAITGDAPILEIKEGVREVIKPRLEQLEGIAFAQISGDVERVIDVEVNRDRLALFNIPLTDMTSAVRAANANIAGGTIRKGRYRYTLRTLGEFVSVNEINDVVVARRNGRDIRVADVATVHDTIKDRSAIATVNGKEAIGLLVYKEAGSNTIEATKLVQGLLTELNKPGSAYQITLAFQEAQFIEQALNNVWTSLIFGGFFAFLVLVLFLEDLKSPLFIFTSIPIAIITTLTLMYFQGISLNVMSLGGLALGVGMLVDNSIVVLENIYRYRQEGMDALKAAYRGAVEVAMPVAASTFTTIAVFFPIVYLEGVAGALFGEQAWTVTYSLSSSLVVSLTVLPLLTALSSILEGRDSLPAQLKAMTRLDAETYPRNLLFWKPWELIIAILAVTFVAAYFKVEWKWIAVVVGGVTFLPSVMFLLKWLMTYLFAWLFQAMTMSFHLIGMGCQWVLDKAVLPVFNYCYAIFEKIYHAILVWALDNKLATLTLSLGVVCLSAYLGLHLKRELMPKSATGQFTVDIKLEPGTALEATALVVEDIERLLDADGAVAIVFSQVGASEANLAQLLQDSGTNTAEMSIKLKEAYVSLAEVYRLSEKLRAYGKQRYPGMTLSVKESESALADLLSSEGGSGLSVQIDGEHFEDLYLASNMVVEVFGEIPGLKDIKTTMTRDYPQIQIKLRRDNIVRYGFSLSQVGSFLSGGMRGDLATQFKEFDRQIDVRVRFSESDREDFEKVLDTVLTSPDGTAVPLYELLEVKPIRGIKEVRRSNQRRIALVTANLSGKKISEVAPLVQAKLDLLKVPKGISRPKLTGEQEGLMHSLNQLLMAFLLSALLVYMIMAAQFESLKDPFVVMFAVPMGIVGAVLMMYIFDQSINIMSLIGFVVLSGIVVNDAIVKVDFIKNARAAGSTTRDAIFTASRVRLRPILMTTVTTVLGLWPMAFSVVPKFMNISFIHAIVLVIDERLAPLGLTPLEQLFSPRGSEIQQPLAIAIIGGISLATMLTLVLIPLLYEVISGRDPIKAAPSEEASA